MWISQHAGFTGREDEDTSEGHERIHVLYGRHPMRESQRVLKNQRIRTCLSVERWDSPVSSSSRATTTVVTACRGWRCECHSFLLHQGLYKHPSLTHSSTYTINSPVSSTPVAYTSTSTTKTHSSTYTINSPVSATPVAYTSTSTTKTHSSTYTNK